MVAISGTKNDRIDLLGCAVNEMRGVPIHVIKRGNLLPILGPVIAHRCGAVGHGDRLAAVFPTLAADVFGRI